MFFKLCFFFLMFFGDNNFILSILNCLMYFRVILLIKFKNFFLLFCCLVFVKNEVFGNLLDSFLNNLFCLFLYFEYKLRLDIRFFFSVFFVFFKRFFFL